MIEGHARNGRGCSEVEGAEGQFRDRVFWGEGLVASGGFAGKVQGVRFYVTWY